MQHWMKIYLPAKEVWPNMAHSLTWLPDVLKAAGLKVSLVDGWANRGRVDVGRIFGVICHHTAGPKDGNMPSLRTLVDGRSDLPGPLAQLGLGRDGTYFVIAAGKANHAGRGSWKGVQNGNANFIGIEAENTGLPNDVPWPAAQMEAYHRGVAAILQHIGQGADFCAGHKEYALPPGRKLDPTFNMDNFRASVAAILNGTTPAPVLIPAVEPPAQPGVPAGRPTLRRGVTSELTKQVQAKVGVLVDGKFGPKTEAAVRTFQRAHGLVPDGIVGPKTWFALDRV
jgi:peptidoglycan hydrolase-like protein with peptidoglycan-binding domain